MSTVTAPIILDSTGQAIVSAIASLSSPQASAYTGNPSMDGAASPGSSSAWARGDHVHPSDTGKQAKITVSGILKGDGNGGVSAAVAGTDYGTYSKPSGGIPASDLASGVLPSVPSAYTSNPTALGTANPGSSTAYAKGDHIHPKPSASDIGAAASDLGITNASVGQVVTIGAVDGNGKPTAFATATLLSAAGVSF